MSWIEFLQQWWEDGHWSLGAIDPATNEHEWLTSGDMAELEDFVDHQQSLGRNLYCQLNFCRELGGARASKSDVVLAICVAAEIDPPETITTPEALAEWQRQTAEQWTDPDYWADKKLPTPSLLVFSGSGFQAAWRLVEDVQLVSVVDGEIRVDREAIDRVEDVNRGICHAVGGDTASTGVERLLRLPGSVNFPGPSKLKKGRTGPVESELMYLDPQVTHALSVFPRHERKVSTPSEIPSFAGLPPPEKLAEASEVLADAWPEKGRHNAFLALSGGLAQAGWPADAVEALTVAVAQRMSGSDEKAIRDRGPMASTTVDKVASGMVVKSWGTLVAEHGIQPATLRQVQSLLGIPDQSAPERDDAFFDALLQKHKHRALHGGPPTDLEYRARIRAEINRRSHSRDPKELAVREVYKRLLSGACLTDSPDENLEKALVDAAALLVNLSRDATIEQHERQLLGPAGRLSHEVREAIDAAIAQHDDKTNQTSATEFGRNSQGEVLCSGPPLLHNFEIAVTRMGYEFKYNRFADRKLMRASADGEWDTIQDAEVNKLRFDVCKTHQFLMPKGEVFDMVSYRAHEHSFHPVLDYLDGLEAWDGTVRVGGDDQPSWLTRYCGVKDSPYTRAVGRLLLCAAVRRIRQPGCKFDEMVILEGGQGVGKSKMWRFLCPDPEWFTDDFSLKYDTKQIMEITKGKWFIECPELKGKTDGDLTHLKALLSRSTEVSRMAYGREAEERKRQFVLVGTTNESEYLLDLTGDRRYWPVEVGFIDLEALVHDRDQIWAEANHLEQQHPEETFIRLDPSLYAAAAVEQLRRRIADPHVVALSDYLFSVEGSIRLKDVWRLLGHHDEKLPSGREQKSIVAAMAALGWKKETRQDGAIWYGRGTGPELKLAGSGVQGYKLAPAAPGVAAAPQPESTSPRVVEDRSN